MNIINISKENFVLLEKARIKLEEIFYLERIGAENNANINQGLLRKGMIDENGKITSAGKELLLKLGGNEPIDARPIVVDNEGINSLHKKLEDVIVKYTGKKQARGDINGTKFSFLCGEADLIQQIQKVIVKYKLKDYSSIEAALLKYVDRACRTKQYFPIVYYYISKDGQSKLVADLVDAKETEEIKEKKTAETFI